MPKTLPNPKRRPKTPHKILRFRDKPKPKVVMLTYERIAKKAKEVIKQIDARKNAQNESRVTETVKQTVAVPLIVEGKLQQAGIHYITEGTCHRPDLFFAGKRACDLCKLYPWCLAPVKKLKIKGSQPEDRNPAYFKAQKIAAREAETSGLEIIQRAKPRIKLVFGKRAKRTKFIFGK